MAEPTKMELELEARKTSLLVWVRSVEQEAKTLAVIDRAMGAPSAQMLERVARLLARAGGQLDELVEVAPALPSSATVGAEGRTVRVFIENSDDGPVAILASDDSSLEGIAPGEYLLREA